MARTKSNGNGGKNAKRGPPTKYKPEYDEQARILCETFGAKDKDLAAVFKVDESSIANWVRDHRSLFRCIRDGRDEYNVHRVENSLLDRALGCETTETKIEDVSVKIPAPEQQNGNGSRRTKFNGDSKNGRNGKGRKQQVAGTTQIVPGIRRTVTTKHYPPDVTAAIYWLINRSRLSKRWQHIQNVAVGLETGGPRNQEIDLTQLEPEELDQLHVLIAQAAKTANERRDAGAKGSKTADADAKRIGDGEGEKKPLLICPSSLAGG